jgi:hypothetical protein
LGKFFEGARSIWKKWLSRRSNNGYIPWEKMEKILERHPLPKPRIVHGAMGTRAQIPLFGEYN